MSIAKYFPIWDKLRPEERAKLESAAYGRTAPAGTLLHSGQSDCVGLLIVRAGQLRAFSLSDEGKEITLYRLFERDICLFSASCIMSSIQFELSIEAERDSELWVISADVYRSVMETSVYLANYTNELMATRFSEVMWLVEQIMWKSFDKRLASFLLEESRIDGSSSLHITHEKIAKHLGTAREVVTRMLKYFQSEGLVKLSRGEILLADMQRLIKTAA